MTITRVHLVVPCFNEQGRLDLDYWSSLARSSSCDILFVDDGSTDKTLELLTKLTEYANVRVLHLDTNHGKSEALRQGLLEALKYLEVESRGIVGFIDADGAFSGEEILRFIEVAQSRLSDGQIDSVFASRVALAGHQIRRTAFRHYAGRVFASITSLTFGFRIYDTQAGLKLFRDTQTLRDVIRAPMKSRWLFEIELLTRFLRVDSPLRVWEEPVRFWEDVPGSKLTLKEIVKSMHDFAKIVN